MQKRETVKDFRVSIYYTKIFYYLHISRTYLPCVFVWADCV